MIEEEFLGLAHGKRISEATLNKLDALRRKRVLLMDHIMVLRFYGRKGQAPDAQRSSEIRAARLWAEAIYALNQGGQND